MDIRKLKQLLVLLVAILVGVSGFYYKYISNKNAIRYYLQGVEFYNNQKYSDAYYNFKQIKSISKMYEISLLKQFQCAQKLDDKKTAHAKLKEIIKKTKNKHIKPWALYYETLLGQELNQYNKKNSYKKYKFIYDNFPKSDFGIASAYKSAFLSESFAPNAAKEKLIKYLSYAPSGKFAYAAMNELLKLNVVFNKDDYKIIADAKLLNQQYKDALSYYQKTSFSDSWYNISKCYRGLNDNLNEQAIILKGLKVTSKNVDEKDISNAIDRLVVLKKINKTEFLQELYVDFQNTYIFPTIAYKLAEVSNSVRSYKLYETVVNDYPESVWASNSLWELFWNNYQESRYKACEKIANKHFALYEDTQDAPRMNYWYGRVLLKQRKNQMAREVFFDVINDYPLTYYAFLSARQLKMSKANKMIVKKPIVNYDRKILNKLIFEDNIMLQLANFNDWELIEEFKINDEYIKSWILYQKENYPLAINYARDEIIKDNKKKNEENNSNLFFSNQMLKMMYPILYQNEINHYAQEFKQSAYLFLSLIREESHFDKKAQSAVGAKGLSQLMNATANFIDNKKIANETLFNPEENIRLGMKYFNYLVNKFNGDERLAILAYNAGPGNVSKWLNDPNINNKPDEFEAFVENIPYLETKNYIKKIFSTYWTYLNIYSPKNK